MLEDPVGQKILESYLYLHISVSKDEKLTGNLKYTMHAQGGGIHTQYVHLGLKRLLFDMRSGT
jgi:hypothetical protein